MLIRAKFWALLGKYAGLEREASLADLVFAIYIEQRSKFAALMLLRMSRASEIGENIFIHSDEIYKGSASLKISPPEWSPLCEEKSTARRFENKKEMKKLLTSLDLLIDSRSNPFYIWLDVVLFEAVGIP